MMLVVMQTCRNSRLFHARGGRAGYGEATIRQAPAAPLGVSLIFMTGACGVPTKPQAPA